MWGTIQTWEFIPRVRCYSHGNWSVFKMLHQFICSQEQIDLTVDGIVYKPQKSDHSGHFLLCCDWPLVPKLTVIGAFNKKLINYLGNHKIFKYFIKWIGSCWQMNWYNILGTLQLPRLYEVVGNTRLSCTLVCQGIFLAKNGSRDYSMLELLPLFWILTIFLELDDLTLCNVNLTWAAVLY